MGVNFFCTIAILTKTTNTMKLRNSFLIAAGVFFFAVAFVNFAKAGDGGGEEPNPAQENKRTVYDQDCTAYLWQMTDVESETIIRVINTSGVRPGTRYMLIDSKAGKKDGCEDYEGDICFPSECSSIWDL